MTLKKTLVSILNWYRDVEKVVINEWIFFVATCIGKYAKGPIEIIVENVINPILAALVIGLMYYNLQEISAIGALGGVVILLKGMKDFSDKNVSKGVGLLILIILLYILALIMSKNGWVVLGLICVFLMVLLGVLAIAVHFSMENKDFRNKIQFYLFCLTLFASTFFNEKFKFTDSSELMKDDSLNKYLWSLRAISIILAIAGIRLKFKNKTPSS